MNVKPFVEFRGITKTFPGVKALSDVSIDFYPGKVHVLLGENGAGKSTIVKIISGVYQADQGELFVSGEKQTFTNTRQALKKGISVIHQELSVIDDLTVAENIFLGREPKLANTGFIDRKMMYTQTKELLNSIGVEINPKQLVRKLTNGDKQMVEIARAVSQNSAMVIMDEPTSSLSDHEVQALFRVIQKLKRENVAMIYISHRMKEIAEIGDTITILRDGQLVKTMPLSETDEQSMIALMVGRKMTQYYFKAEPPEKAQTVLSVKNLTEEGVFENVSFDLYQGEILGVSGLIGAGRTEVMRAIFGADRFTSGEIEVFGKKSVFTTPQQAIKAGIGLIPEDRRNQGLLLGKNLRINTSLASLMANSNHGAIDFSWERSVTAEYIDKLHTKTPTDQALAKNLSGGNQQKVVIAKWLAAQVRILIMDEPTRGIDINAKAEIYALMKKFVENGGSIVMVSSELPEILGVSNRIMVMREGQVTKILDAQGATEKEIMQYASFNSETEARV